jgi:NADH-quinone oxidoreductase subunit J
MTASFEIIAFSISAFVAVAGALGMATTMSMFRSGIFLMASFIGVAGLFILLAADLMGVLQIMMYIGGFLVMILFMIMVMHDPGGAMMAGMDMSLIERWFSKGLVPRAPPDGNDDGQMHHRGHKQANSARKQHAQENGRDPEKRGPGHHGGKGGSGMQAGGASHGGMDMGGMDMSMVTPVRPIAAWLAGAVGLLLVGMLVLRPNWRFVEALPDPDSARRVGHLLMEKYMIAFEGAGFLILIGIFGSVLLARPSSYPDESSRAARVAVDAGPEPIRDEGLRPLAEQSPASALRSDRRHSDEHGA